MCDPITIAGIALTAGSTVANSIANSQVQKARNDALAAERIRQTGYDQEAAAINAKDQESYQDFSGQQATKSQELGDYFQGQQLSNQTAANEQTAAASLPTSASNITVAEEAKQRRQGEGLHRHAGGVARQAALVRRSDGRSRARAGT